jgi:hypothetical protein
MVLHRPLGAFSLYQHPLPLLLPLQAGSRALSPSFQRNLVPLLRLITTPLFLNSPLTHMVNPVLARAAEALDLRRVAACLQQIRARRSVADDKYMARRGEVRRWPCKKQVHGAAHVPSCLVCQQRCGGLGTTPPKPMLDSLDGDSFKLE